MNITGKNKTGIIFLFLFILVMSAGLVGTLYLTHQNQDIRRKASDLSPTQLPFYVSLDTSSVLPGESVIISVYDNDSKQLPYNGYIFVKSRICIESQNCKSYTGQYVNNQGKPVYFSNGTATIDIPVDSPPQTTRMRFITTYPSKKLDWSNEITLTVNSKL